MTSRNRITVASFTSALSLSRPRLFLALTLVLTQHCASRVTSAQVREVAADADHRQDVESLGSAGRLPERLAHRPDPDRGWRQDADQDPLSDVAGNFSQ